MAEEVEGGGVGLFRRPPVRVRKAVKMAWVEERRSGVWGTLSVGGDIRLGVAGCLFPFCSRLCGDSRRATGSEAVDEEKGRGASASSSWVLLGSAGAGFLMLNGSPGATVWDEGVAGGGREATRGGFPFWQRGSARG